jgi:hypothetical protein
MQSTTGKNTGRADQLQALRFTGEDDHTQHRSVMQKACDIGTQRSRYTRAAGGLELVHLSETGLHAGRRLCLAPQEPSTRSVHAMYAPLNNPTFLATVCKKCLQVWALEAYEDGEEIPDYLVEARAIAKMPAATKEADIGADQGRQ